MQEQDFTIFLSHAAVDHEMANSMKEFISKVLPNQRVFVSSDPEDLKPGDPWVQKVLNALTTAKIVLTLATERGLERKWVWFEAGRAWFTGVSLIPCCIGNVRKNNMIAPFSGLTALNIDEPRDASALFESLQNQFGDLAETPDYQAFTDTMIRMDVRADELAKIKDDPDANEIQANIEETMRTLNPAERETIRQFMIYEKLSTSGVRGRVTRTRVDMGNWMVPDSLIARTGWLTPEPGNAPRDDLQQNVYTINAVVRPHLRAYFSSQK